MTRDSRRGFEFPCWTLCYHESYHDNIKNENQWIYQYICDIQIIWKLSYVNLLRIIVFEPWTMLIVIFFLVLILSIWITIKPNNLNFILEFLKNMIKPPSLLKSSYKISAVHLSICLSVRLSATHFFSGSTRWIFLIVCVRTFCHIY